jgi:hypothetical protein
MESRWFNAVVGVFWATTMSWLFVAKILPPLRRGEPPNYQSVLAAQQAETVPVQWRISWNNQNVGYANHRLIRLRSGDTEIQSRVDFDRLPLTDLFPPMLQGQVKQAIGSDGPLQLRCVSRLNIDSTGKLTGFRSHVRIGDSSLITLTGTVIGPTLKVTVGVGATHVDTSITLPSDALVGNALSPQSYLPGLRLGQQWTVPIFNPLRPEAVMEVLQATVPRDEWIIWDGQPVEARVVEFRSDDGSAQNAENAPQSRLWVDPRGMVLKQEARILRAVVAFERLPDQVDRRRGGVRAEPADAPASDEAP